MIKIQHITLYQGSQLLIEHGEVFIQMQQKVGIVGLNGSGKTSLLQAILGRLDLHRGEIIVPHHLQIAYIEQTIPSLEETAIDYVMRAKPRIHETYLKLKHAEQHNNMEQVALLHAELSEMNAYSFKAEAEKTLHGLGFLQSQLQQEIASFSGGWRMRLHLGRCLLMDSDLLLLDEPTNHLDLKGILWLQDWLHHYKGTLLLISHDRDFLDNVVTHILHLHRQQLQLYTGNYTDFIEQRTQALTLQAAQYKKQQQQVKHLQSYVDRFRYKASKAKQAQSRLKAIERLEKIAPILAESGFDFDFQAPESLSNPLMTLNQLTLGYGNKILLRDINLSVEKESRIGLLGANGAGKSTFLKALTGELNPVSGEIIRNSKLHMGYFSQHQVEQFTAEQTPLKIMQMAAPQMSEGALRSYLGFFGFSGEKALSTCAKLSGGEKARLALANIIWHRPHILLLDEPTNHLDLNMREALNLALQNYQGAIVLITHDRFLLRSIADELWLVNDGTVKPFSGDLDDYAQLLLQSSPVNSTINHSEKVLNAKTQRRLSELEKQINKLNKAVETIDQEMLTLTQNVSAKNSASWQTIQQLTDKKDNIIAQIQQVEEEWYLLHE